MVAEQVDAEKALAERWWYKPPYIINELNINSAVVYPRHGEVVSLKRDYCTSIMSSAGRTFALRAPNGAAASKETAYKGGSPVAIKRLSWAAVFVVNFEDEVEFILS